jgi:hypothetical protein
MKIIFIGDVFSSPGREIIKKKLPALREKFNPDFVFANVENLSGGRGATDKNLREIKNAGVDFFTGGNHIFERSEVFSGAFADEIIRPANFPENCGGRGAAIFEKNDRRILAINLSGRVFMKPDSIDCPFQTFEKIWRKFKSEKFDAAILDFHAETTSEKAAMKFFADGKLSAIFGTHTHVSTADAQISPAGTFFVSDVGMCGAENSLLGFSFESVWPKFCGEKTIFQTEKKAPGILNGYFLEIKNCRSICFERIRLM